MLDQITLSQRLQEGLSVVPDSDLMIAEALVKTMVYCGYAPEGPEEMQRMIDDYKMGKTVAIPIVEGSAFSEEFPDNEEFDFTTQKAIEKVIVSTLTALPDAHMKGFSVGELVEHKKFGIGKIIEFVGNAKEPYAKVDFVDSFKFIDLKSLNKIQKEDAAMARTNKSTKKVKEEVVAMTNNTQEEAKMTKEEQAQAIAKMHENFKDMINKEESTMTTATITKDIKAEKAAKYGVDVKAPVVSAPVTNGKAAYTLRLMDGAARLSVNDPFWYRKAEGLAKQETINVARIDYRANNGTITPYYRVEFTELNEANIDYMTVWNRFAGESETVAKRVSVKLVNGVELKGFKVRYSKNGDGSLYLQDPSYRTGEGDNIQWKSHVTTKGHNIFEAQILAVVEALLEAEELVEALLELEE